MERIDRREFLRRAAVFTAAVALNPLLEACGPTAVSNRPQTGGVENPLNAPEVQINGNQFVLEAIIELPDSPIKTILQRRVSTYLQSSPKANIEIAGVNIPVQKATVRFETTEDVKVTSGTFEQIVENNSLESVTATENVNSFMPYVGLLKPEEKDSYHSAPNGTPFLPFEMKSNDKALYGIAPGIVIIALSDANIRKLGDANTQKNYRDRLKAIGVKESLQWVLIQVMEETMVDEMNKVGIPSTIQAKRSDGSTIQTEVITGTVENLGKNNGRFKAALDAAATVVMIKAYSQQELSRIFGNTTLAEAVAALKDVNLGNNERDILLNALKFVQTDPVGQRIFHFGDYNKIP